MACFPTLARASFILYWATMNMVCTHHERCILPAVATFIALPQSSHYRSKVDRRTVQSSSVYRAEVRCEVCMAFTTVKAVPLNTRSVRIVPPSSGVSSISAASSGPIQLSQKLLSRSPLRLHPTSLMVFVLFRNLYCTKS